MSEKHAKLTVQKDFLEEISTPIFVKNKNGVYTYCNKAFSEFLGMPKIKILGATAYDIAPRKLAKIYEEADKTLFGQLPNQEYVAGVKTKDESEVTVTFKKSIIYDANHAVNGFIGCIQTNSRIIHHAEGELANLSKREIGVLNLLIKGNSVKAIATLLDVSHHTINDHLKVIYKKLGVHSKGEALYRAITLLSSA